VSIDLENCGGNRPLRSPKVQAKHSFAWNIISCHITNILGIDNSIICHCLSSFSVGITKTPGAGYSLKKIGLVSSQFWRLKFQDRTAPPVHPLMSASLAAYNKAEE
jgi:hypothetical protein